MDSLNRQELKERERLEKELEKQELQKQKELERERLAQEFRDREVAQVPESETLAQRPEANPEIKKLADAIKAAVENKGQNKGPTERFDTAVKKLAADLSKSSKEQRKEKLDALTAELQESKTITSDERVIFARDNKGRGELYTESSDGSELRLYNDHGKVDGLMKKDQDGNITVMKLKNGYTLDFKYKENELTSISTTDSNGKSTSYTKVGEDLWEVDGKLTIVRSTCDINGWHVQELNDSSKKGDGKVRWGEATLLRLDGIVPDNGEFPKKAGEEVKLGICPESLIRKLTDAELKNRTPDELVLMNNEIFARHGAVIGEEQLDRYFGNQSWYKPQPDLQPEEVKLTEIEKENALKIQKTMKDRNIDPKKVEVQPRNRRKPE